MSVVFLSHSSADGGVSKQLVQWLNERQHSSIFLDFDPAAGIPSGRDWELELYRQLKSCRALVILCSQQSMDSKWCFAELAIARSLGKPVFPLIIEPCDLPSHLHEVQVINFHQEGAEKAFARLAVGLQAAGIEDSADFVWDRSRSPYPGLLAYREEDAGVFFGREEEISEGKELLNRVGRFGESGLVLVLGASGSGKSSLVRAGLLPRLRLDDKRWLVVDVFRPRNDPMRELAGALAAAFERQGRTVAWEEILGRLHKELEENPASARVLDEILDDLRLSSGRHEAKPLLVIDQFEELLVREPDHPARKFLQLLRTAVDRPDPPYVVLGTLRSDSLGALQTDPALEALAFGSLSVGPLPADRRARIIEGPAELAAITIEPGLTQTLLADMDTEDALPLLAFTLAQLFENCSKEGVMSVKAYREQLGGLRGSVARAAERVMTTRRYSETDLDKLRLAFLAMARLDADGRYVRRSASWHEIGDLVGGTATARSLLQPFLEARLLVSRGSDETSAVEVAHEAMFRAWQTMAEWLDHHRDDLRLGGELTRAADRWQLGDHSADFLWRGARLERALEVRGRGSLPLGHQEHAFLKTSHGAEKRKGRVKTLSVLTLVVVALAIAVVMSWQARREARARDLADLQVSRYLARQSRDHLATQHDLALLLGIRAYGTAQTFEATSHLLTALQEAPRLISFVPGSTRRVSSLSFAAEGSWLAHGGYGQTLRIWDNISNRSMCEVELEGIKNWITDLESPAAGGLILSASDDGVIRGWKAQSCEMLFELEGHVGRVASLAASETGQLISGGDKDQTVWLWSLDDHHGSELGRHDRPVQAVAITPDGRIAASADLDGTLLVWDLEQQQLLDEIPRAHGAAISCVLFDHSGTLLISGGGGNPAIRYWPLEPGQDVPGKAPGHSSPVMSLALHATDQIIASGSQQGKIRVWQLDRPQRRLELAELGGPVHALGFDPADATRLVSATGAQGSVRIWSVALGGEADQHWLQRPSSLAFGPDGHRLAVVDDGTVRFLDTLTGLAQGVPFPSFEGEDVTDVCLSPTGQYLATASDDGTVHLWDPISRQAWPLPNGHDGGAASISFSSDGALLASGGEDNGVRIWKVDEHKHLHSMSHDDWVNIVAFAPDGPLLATAGDDGTVRLWDALSGELKTAPLMPDNEGFPVSVTHIAFGQRGRVIAAAYDDGKVRFWNRDGALLADDTIACDGAVAAVAFSPDGQLLAVGSSFGQLQIWRLDTATQSTEDFQVLPFATIDDDDGITSLSFHPQKSVLAVLRSASVEFVDLTGITSWTAQACNRANRGFSKAEWNRLIGPDIPFEDICLRDAKGNATID